jgi:hypothetical protein
MATQFIGRRINLGIGREATRGTGVTPTFWVPRTTLNFDFKVNKHLEEESLGVIEDSDATFVTEKWGEGNVEGEVRDKSFGLMLYAMLGSVSSALVGGEAAVYDHTFSLSQTNNHQSLTFTVNNPISDDASEGDYRFPLVMLDSLDLTLEVGGVATYTSTWMSRPGDKWTKATASYTVENKFRATDLIFKVAADRASLGAASATAIKSLTIKFTKNLLRSMVLGTVEPDDLFNQQFGLEGTITLDHTSNTWRDYMLNNTYRAMSIQLLNAGVTIGNTSNPTLTFVMPRVHFMDWESDKSLNDISKQTVNFKALRDVANSESSIYSVVLRNTTASY